MASWMAFYRVNSAAESDSTLCWQPPDGLMSPEDPLSHNHLLFRQFSDLDHVTAASAPSLERLNLGPATQPYVSNAISVHHPSSSSSSSAERPVSSAVSSTDEADLLSAPSAGFADQPHQLPLFSGSEQPLKHHLHQRTSSSSILVDSALKRFGQVSIHSPVKMEAPVVASHPPISPTPRSNHVSKRQPKRIVEAISSTIKKAAHLRKGKKQVQVQVQPAPERSASPTLEHPPMAIKDRKERVVGGIAGANTASSISLSVPYHNPHYSQSASFIHGYCDDPFGDFLQNNPASSMGFLGANGNGISEDVLKGEHEAYHQAAQSYSPKTAFDADGIPSDMNAGPWQTQHLAVTSLAAEQWAGSAVAGYTTTGPESDWWDGINVFSEAKHADASHHALQPPHLDLGYTYDFAPPMLDNVVMVGMPPQPGTLHDGQAQVQQTYLPPPPPVPATKERGRTNRPPKARSSGARHQNPSPSPMRKTRGPSASPNPKSQSQPQSQSSSHQRRHSSTGSISSARSASGRVSGPPAPGTPGGHGIRKRRSRDAGLLCSVGGGGGGDDMGFVNFTPNDGSLLMTGVAPSGSSKTKARREKEAQERRRKLSEAAMKAVVAAGGDVDKLIQEGFVF